MLYVKKGNFINRKKVEQRAKEEAAGRGQGGKPDSGGGAHYTPAQRVAGGKSHAGISHPFGAPHSMSGMKGHADGMKARQSLGNSVRSEVGRETAASKAKASRPNQVMPAIMDVLKRHSEQQQAKVERVNFNNLQLLDPIWGGSEFEAQRAQREYENLRKPKNRQLRPHERRPVPWRDWVDESMPDNPEVRGRGAKMGALVDLYNWLLEMDERLARELDIDVDEFINETDILLQQLKQADALLNQRGKYLAESDVDGTAQLGVMTLDYDELTKRYYKLHTKLMERFNDSGHLTQEQRDRLEHQLKLIDYEFMKRYQMR